MAYPPIYRPMPPAPPERRSLPPHLGLILLGLAAVVVVLIPKRRVEKVAPPQRLPVVCSSRMTISDVRADASNAIVAVSGCRLTLVRVIVRGATPITAQSGAVVTVRGGSYDGLDTPAVLATHGGSVILEDAPFLAGNRTVMAQKGGSVVIRSANVSGQVAVVATTDGTVDVTGATILGEVVEDRGRIVRGAAR